jgi:multiple sugar transport system substrate-binding protein
MKKFFMILLIVSIILSIVGFNVSAQATGETVKLIVLAQEPDFPQQQACWDNAFRTFEEAHPGTQIEFQKFPWKEVLTKLIAADLAGNAPDVVDLNTEFIAPAIEKNLLLPIDELYDDEFLAGFVPGTLETGISDGILYGLPLKINVRVITYNKRIFSEAGITELPKNWSEFIEVSKKLTVDKDGDGVIDQYGISFGVKQYWLATYPFVVSNGGSILNDDYTKCTLDQPEAIETVEFIYDIVNKQKVMPPGEIERDKNAARSLFIAEKVAMYEGGLFENGVLENLAPDLDYGMFIFPGGNLRSGNLLSNITISIPTKSKHPELAAELMKWLVDPSNVCLVDTLPARKDTLQLEPYSTDERFIVSAEQIIYSKPYPMVNGFSEMLDIYSEYIERALIGDMSPKEAMVKATEEIDRILDRNN